MTKKNTIFQWLAFGFLAGLLTTLLESLFMLDPDISVPHDYPVILFIFNLLFWPALYATIGWLFSMFVQTKGSTSYNNSAGIVSLLFFTITYGFFSKTGLFNYFPEVLTRSADKQLSFVWVACALVLGMYVRKTKNLSSAYPLSYIPDIALIAGLFLFCSNTHSIVKYIAGIGAIGALYLMLLLKGAWFNKKPLVTYAVLFLLVFTSLACCYTINRFNTPKPTYAQPQKLDMSSAPPVILIVLDTLRADRLSLYNGPVPVPHLEQFAADSTVFDHCIANSSWTPPSHASLFTGLYPSEHGCVEEDSSRPFPVLSGSLQTLAETLRDHGYQTAAIVANFGFLGRGTGFEQGFQTYDCRRGIGSIFTERSARPLVNLFMGMTGLRPKYVIPYAVAEDINATIIRTLNKRSTSKFFFFINYMDPHNPYFPPLPYAYSLSGDPLATLKRAAIARTMGKNTAYNAFWLSQYDAEAACLDANIGKLFSYLKKTGLYDSSLIIVTSDHGEMFGEHGLADHRCELYQEVVHVPLIIKMPMGTRAGLREQTTLTLREVFHKIITFCKLPFTVNAQKDNETFFSAVAELHDQQFGLQQAFYYQNYKYMTYEKNKVPQLFNLKTDPAEQTNLFQKSPEIQKTMEAEIEKWRRKHTLKIVKEKESATGPEEAEDALKRLRSLGYIK